MNFNEIADEVGVKIIQEMEDILPNILKQIDFKEIFETAMREVLEDLKEGT